MIREPEFEGRQPVRILLLEDDRQFAELLQMQLRRMPEVESRLVTVGTLARALERLSAENFSLVLADLELPDSHGVDTLKALRPAERPVIVLTGSQDPAVRSAALDSGAYDFLSKDRLSATALERLVRLAAVHARAFGALRESDALKRGILEASVDAVIAMDHEGRVVEFNPAAEKIFGYARADILGREMADLVIPPEHRQAHRRGLAHYLATGEGPVLGRRIEVTAQRCGGSRFDAELTIVRIPGCEPPLFTGTLRDISQRKRAEEELRRFRGAMDASPDMILLVEYPSLRLIDMNSTTCRLLGYSRDELLAMGPQDILPVTRDDLVRSYERMVADPSSVSGMRSYYRCKDGSRLPFESTRRPIRAGEGWIVAVISRDLRELEAVDQALRESEERFRSLLALSTDWYWQTDQEHRFVGTPSGVTRVTGLAASAYVGKCRWEVPGLSPASGDWSAHRAVLDRRESWRDLELVQVRADGSHCYLQISGEPLYDAAGAFKGYRGTARDITERKRREQEMQHLGRMYRALGAANEAILRANSQQEALERACEIAVQAGEFVLGAVYLVSAGDSSLSRAAASGTAAALAEQVAPSSDASQPSGQGMIGEACRGGRPVITNDYEEDWGRRRRQRGIARSYRVGSAAVFPLKVEGALAGVLTIQHARRQAFTDELTALLQRLADNLAFALENFRRDAQRRRAKRKLGESEERFRSLTGLSSDLYWEQDAEYRFTAFSGAAPDGFRPDRERMIGRHRWDDHYFNMSEAAWAAHRADLDARRVFRDLELGRIDESGNKVWASVSGEPVFDEAGVFKGYRGVGRDISARKRAAQLRDLEHSVTRSLGLADSVEEALLGVIRAVCEAEGWECGRYFSFDAAANLLRTTVAWGIEREEVRRFVEASIGATLSPGEGVAGRVWQIGAPIWVSDLAKDTRSSRPELLRATGMRGSFMFPILAEGRTIGVLGFNSRTERAPEDELMKAIGVIGSQVGQFVQRKQAETALRERERRFRTLTELTSDWYWEQDAELRFVSTSGESDERGGITPQAHVGQTRWELPNTEVVGQTWDEHRAVLEARAPFHDLLLRRTAADGTVRYVSVAGRPLFDAQGSFTGYCGVAKDITERMQAEIELRRFRAALDGAADVVVLLDARTGLHLDCNETARHVLGYSREELLRLRNTDIRVDRSAHRLSGDYQALAAASGASVTDQGVCRRKDGSTFPAEFTRRLLETHSGPVVVAHIRDLTERVEIEQRQAAHLHYQERIARFGQSALARHEPAELILEAVQTTLETLGADAVAYLEVEAGSDEAVVRAVVGLAEAVAAPLGRPQGALAQVLATGSRFIGDGGALPMAWARDLRNAALIPVRGDNRVRGALCVCRREAHAFAADELNFVEAAASVLSTGLRRIESEGRLAYLAQFDALTGLPNRALLADRFEQMIVLARRRKSPLGVLFIDLDEFKHVNDTLGHAAGDELLKEVAVRLQSAVRQGDTVARISGDEFAIVLADLAKPEDAALVAQKVLERLAQTLEIGGRETFITASVGIASFPADGGDAEALIGAADAAMYRAKQSGRNAYQFFTPDLNQRLRARVQMAAELRRAVEREEFTLAYQPKYGLSDRRPRGAEALLRWTHPERGPVSPVEFIPVLEETGLIVQAGEWVLARACEDLRAWRAAGIEVGSVAVNLSARQFRQAELDRRLKQIVAGAGIAPAAIELEVTESHVMQDPAHAVQMLRSLCDAGMRIAIDDFGTGYSSLSYLTRFPPGSLKIDRSFVKNMFDDPGHATIVRIVIEMAHTLGFTVVAEGVETEQQAELLRLLRCELAQGYLFAKPMPAAALAELFRVASKKS